MTRLTDVFPGLKVTPVIGILRGLGSEEAEMAAGLALEAGIPLIEVTLDTEGAFDQIKRLTDRGVTTGAGSVLTENAAERAFSVGAAFIITPAVVPSVVRACAEASIPCIPGAATPTEITMALDLGAAAVKVFPADLLGGPAYLRAIRRPLHDPPLIPTGGIGPDNAAEYLRAGALAIGIGSSVFAPGSNSDELERRVGLLIGSLGAPTSRAGDPGPLVPQRSQVIGGPGGI